MSAAAVVLDLGRVRAHRWMFRAGLGELVDRRPGGSPVHGLLPTEETEILAVFEQWVEIDRSHRKLAHRGSYLHPVLGVAVDGSSGAGVARQTLPAVASAGAVAAPAIPGVGGVPAERPLRCPMAASPGGPSARKQTHVL
ncbi:MAG TPA: hypothetical protein VIJ23_19895 [Mycobacterium sp.]